MKKDSRQVILVSGFLGAGKTTFLNHIVPAFPGRKAVLENEFGDVGIDGYLIREEVPVKEIMRGCICCTLLSEFKRGITEIIGDHDPEYIFIEPSGVSSLSEVRNVLDSIPEIGSVHAVTLIESPSFLEYLEDYGDFYSDQIRCADIIFMTMSEDMEEAERDRVLSKVREINGSSPIITEDFRKIPPDMVKDLITEGDSIYFETEKKVTTPGIFSSITLRNLDFPDESTLRKSLELLFRKNTEKILRIKGLVLVGREAPLEVYLINGTRASMDISRDGVLSSREDGAKIFKDLHLVLIGENLEREKVLRLMRRPVIAGRLTNRRK